MKKIIVICILILVFTYLWSEDVDFSGKTVIVVLEPGISSYNAKLDASFFGKIEIESIKNISGITCPEAIQVMQNNNIAFKSIFLITLPIDDQANVLNVVDAINKIKGVDYASPNYILPTAQIPNDFYWHVQYYPPVGYNDLWDLRGQYGVHAPEAWDIATGSRSIRVGVIDTGVGTIDAVTGEIGHVDLNDNLLPGKNFFFSPWTPPDSTETYDIALHGHGTKTAGVIGAVGNNSIGTTGINWEVSLVPFRISNDSTFVNYAVEAITEAINRWGNPEQRIQILNLSFEGYGLKLGRTIRDIISSFPNILLVWSAGNRGLNLDLEEWIINGYYDLPNIIAVGAHNQNGQRSIWQVGPEENRSWLSSGYSPSGANVHLFAPGSQGWTTTIYNQYSTFSGTSMAAPHVTGVAALMLSINPTLTPLQIKTNLLAYQDTLYISAPDIPDFPVKKLNDFKTIMHTVSTVLGINQNFQNSMLDLDKGYSVINGAEVEFTNCSFTQNQFSGLLPEYFGFRVFDGTLILDNYTFLSPIVLQAVGPNSTIIIRNSNNTPNLVSKIDLREGGKLIIEDSALTFSGLNIQVSEDNQLIIQDSNLDFTNCTLTLANQGTLIAENSMVTLSNSVFSLVDGTAMFKSRSLLNIVDGAQLIGSVVDPNSDSIVYIENSTFYLSADSSIIGANSVPWQGISWVNTNDYVDNPPVSTLQGLVYGIQHLTLEAAEVELLNVEIHHTGGITASSQSVLTMDNLNYHHNTERINIIQSQLRATNSTISHNKFIVVGSSRDSGVINIANSPTISFMENVHITDNIGMGGISINTALLIIKQCLISDNDNSGLKSYSINPNFVYDGTVFSNNGMAEIIGLGNAFPQFRRSNSFQAYPTVSDDSYVVGTDDQFLLRAIAPIYNPIDITNLVVDTSDDSRFSPSLSSFCSYGPLAALEMYNLGIQYIFAEEYQLAYQTLADLISQYPQTTCAGAALKLLPYIINALGGNFEDLLAMLSSIDDAELLAYYSKIFALVLMFEENYYEAALLYQEIIDNDPVEIYQLLAELDQAFCYYRLMESGVRSLPGNLTSQAQNFDEYLAIQDDIYARINKLTEKGKENIIQPILNFTTNNYPNPFNPLTTITFTLPHAATTTIEIFNIKGQKVKDLLYANLPFGHHQVIWNGSDNRGHTVSSGIYFYQVSVDKFTQTKSMLLLK